MALRTCKSGGECSTGTIACMGEEAGTTGITRSIAAGTTAGNSASAWPKLAGTNGIRLHSLGALFCDLDLSQWPALQQSLVTPGIIKNCGQEMHPPHSIVATMSTDSSACEIARTTSAIMHPMNDPAEIVRCRPTWLLFAPLFSP